MTDLWSLEQQQQKNQRGRVLESEMRGTRGASDEQRQKQQQQQNLMQHGLGGLDVVK